MMSRFSSLCLPFGGIFEVVSVIFNLVLYPIFNWGKMLEVAF